MVKSLRPEMSVRLVAHGHPAARDVFRRHGEEDDREVFGHLESVERFAERRGVDAGRLLGELSAATGLAVDREAGRDGNLHRPFILTALAFALTFGGGWGAYLLTKIGLYREFTGASAADVVAHGAVQLWGFVAVFIVGIALRYLPSVTTRRAPRAVLRRVTLSLFILGVITGFVWALAPRSFQVLGPLSGIALLSAAWMYLAFAWNATRRKFAGVWARSVLAAAAWMVVWGGWTLFLQTRFSLAGPAAFRPEDRAIIMDLAIFGFALGSVYGFGANLLPGFLSTGSVRRPLLSLAFWLHNGGLAVLVVGRWLQGEPTIAAGLCSIAAGTIVYGAALRGLRGNPATSSRTKSHPLLRRYMQLAVAWLLVSTFSMAAIALVEAAGATEVPHAIHGAVRHALTVGFLVTLILGVGQRLIPVLAHTPLSWPGLVTPTFLLIATGNLIRVVSEAMTPWSPASFFVMPVSAILELAALSLFTANVTRTLWPAPDPLIRTGQVAAGSRLSVLLSEHPWIEDELIAWGIEYVKRVRQVPAELTLGTFAKSNGLDRSEFIERVNTALRRGAIPSCSP